MPRSTEWLITSAECVVAKRRARQTTPRGEPALESERAPDLRVPEQDPGSQSAPPPSEDEPDQSIGYRA
jgi:hypothetical protein